MSDAFGASLCVYLDRPGCAYTCGETVTGCVVVHYTTASAFVSVEVRATGKLFLQAHGTDDANFNSLRDLKPLELMDVYIPLHARGEVLPSGRIEFPFSFDLNPTNPSVPLMETYKGVFIRCSYTIVATASSILTKESSSPVEVCVSVLGQGQPPLCALKEDSGVRFELSEEQFQQVGKSDQPTKPSFLLEGFLDRFYNDIDVPLSGWIVVRRCSAKILSMELQMLRVEQAAVPGRVARGVTELQNIQVAEGDVLRNLEIPIYMFFPRWYTCPIIKTPNMRVEFDVNVLVVLEGNHLLTKTIPILLYRQA